MESGRVKWFDSRRGYGFIVPTHRLLPDVFIHYKNISCDGYKSLLRGQLVNFEVSECERGLQAINLLINGSVPIEAELVDADSIGNLKTAEVSLMNFDR
jgi:cold shock protein